MQLDSRGLARKHDCGADQAAELVGQRADQGFGSDLRRDTSSAVFPAPVRSRRSAAARRLRWTIGLPEMGNEVSVVCANADAGFVAYTTTGSRCSVSLGGLLMRI
jgi:hypothetical protein